MVNLEDEFDILKDKVQDKIESNLEDIKEDKETFINILKTNKKCIIITIISTIGVIVLLSGLGG